MILAIDPGSEKTGIALVEEDGRLHKKEIIPTAQLSETAARWAEAGAARAVVMGNGTHHKELRRVVEAGLSTAGLALAVSLVDEKYTTEMGKERYLAAHPAKGFAKLLPRGMRTVPVPVDDYVAWIIGEIFLGTVAAESVGHKAVNS